MLGINYLNPIQTGHFFDCYERGEGGGELPQHRILISNDVIWRHCNVILSNLLEESKFHSNYTLSIT